MKFVKYAKYVVNRWSSRKEFEEKKCKEEKKREKEYENYLLMKKEFEAINGDG